MIVLNLLLFEYNRLGKLEGRWWDENDDIISLYEDDRRVDNSFVMCTEEYRP